MYKSKKKQNKDNLKIASGNSYDLSQPYVPGGQKYDGIPNATPDMLRKLKQRREKNPGGQTLPGFLNKA